MIISKTRRNYIIALALLFVFVSLSETTYSLFLTSNSTDEFSYSTGLLDLQFEEDEKITLQNLFPMLDSEAIKMEPYNLTIKNTGTLPYLFDLTMETDNYDNTIDNRYIKVKVNENTPHTLYDTGNVLVKNMVIYPQEEMTFKINVWLDFNTPNKELGKTFNAKVVTRGSSFYKTVDVSMANTPELNSDMIPIYYNDDTSKWHVANKSNATTNFAWYDYDKGKWANSMVLNDDSNKYIYDITRNNDIVASNVKFNNGNLVIDDRYFDTKLTNYNENDITNIYRMKVDNLDNNIYILSNNNMSYYYDTKKQVFVFKIGNSYVTSSSYKIDEGKWYILGYSYDGNKVNFYIDGDKLSSANINGSMNSSSSFRMGTDPTGREISEITVGNMLIYNRILSDDEIYKHYSASISIIFDGLIAGYEEFIPMTIREYYLSREVGFEINNDDVMDYYVWIPRFKYMVWNVTGEAQIDSYDAYHKGINILFETDTQRSGTIYCVNGQCYNSDLMITKVNQIDNGKYYTHPAFTDGNKELRGFWVSKYELSKSNGSIKSVSGNPVWTDNDITNFINSVTSIGNHVIKNTEWGAITYLSHSKYGVCPNNKCNSVSLNDTYISGANDKDSTTGNKYGVYDMAGSAISFTASKYDDGDNHSEEYELYQTDSFILGDATLELSTWGNGNNQFIDNINKWIIRGGFESGGIYSYGGSSGLGSEYISTRMVIR